MVKIAIALSVSCLGAFAQEAPRPTFLDFTKEVRKELNAGNKSKAKSLLEARLAGISEERTLEGMAVGVRVSTSLLFDVDRRSPSALAYLRAIAKYAINVDAPIAEGTDGTGVSIEFEQWATSKGQESTTGWLQKLALCSISLNWLGVDRDGASTELLRNALKSNQFAFVLAGIQGLTRQGTSEQYADEMVTESLRVARSETNRDLLAKALLDGGSTPYYRGRIRRFFGSEDAYRQAVERHTPRPK